MKNYYGASITPVNFKDSEDARQMINTWVEEKTKDKIKDLIPQGLLDALTRLVLVNAIYFKANWTSQFEPSRTKKTLFHRNSDESSDTLLMAQQATFNYGEADGLQILELPYGQRSLSMIILLPAK